MVVHRSLRLFASACTAACLTWAAAAGTRIDRAYTSDDLALFIPAFGSAAGTANFVPEFDFNGDGIINGADHSVLLSQIRRSSSAQAHPALSQTPVITSRPKKNNNQASTPPEPPPTPPAPPPPPPAAPPPESSGSNGGNPAPPPSNPNVQRIVNTTISPQGEITMTDAMFHHRIISPNGGFVWEPTPGSRNVSLRPTWTMTELPDGFDLVFHYHNNTGAKASLGQFIIGGIRFGETVKSRDFAHEGKEYTIRHRGRPYFDGGYLWPDQMYSPLASIKYNNQELGFSVQYPVLDYKHRVFMRMEVPGGYYTHTGLNWSLRIVLNPEEQYSADGDLRPGETRTYRVTCRVAKNNLSEWVRLFVPYRDYFRSIYGFPNYTRDPRPVKGVTTSQLSAVSNGNPYGFVSPYGGPNASTVRPDLYGWGPHIQEWQSDRAMGWERFMIWTPTGLFKNNRHWNYPFQFTSQWRQMPAVMNSLGQLRQFAEQTGEFGLWWGRSTQVMRTWDTNTVETFDPDRAAHQRLALDELVLARQVKANCIGLDTYSVAEPWKAYTWLARMKEELPGAKFIIEPVMSDIMHQAAPMFILGTRAPGQEFWALTTPHILADFINPGHETWAFIDHSHTRLVNGGREPTVQEMQQIVRNFARLGYVPVEHWRFPADSSMNAVKSWEFSIPADIRENPPE